jgi:hypothetical protein
MPYSDGSLRPWILERILKRLSPVTVVDVGAGAGLNLDFFKPHFPGSFWTAIEVWKPYLAEFSLPQRYSLVLTGDVRELTLPPADLYILGDVLEHMEKEEAIDLWNRARAASKLLVASLPIIEWPQGAEHGNPYEEHVHHWCYSEVLVELEGISATEVTDTVGAFFAQGLR